MNTLILSRNKHLYSTKRLLDESNLAGHTTAIVDYMHCNILNEKNNPAVLFNSKPLRHIDVILPRIGASFSFYGASVIRQFEIQGIATLVRSNALMKARDKLHCLQALTGENIGMPKTYFTHFFYNMDEIITDVGGFPFIIKQLQGTQGHGVYLIKNRKHANEIINAHQSANIEFMIQEFISEANGADIRAFVVGDQVIAAYKRQAQKGEFRSNLHQGGCAKQIQLNEQEVYTAIQSVKTLGLQCAGVDMLQSKRGPLILEVNASPGLEGIEKTTQVNVAALIIQRLEKLKA